MRSIRPPCGKGLFTEVTRQLFTSGGLNVQWLQLVIFAQMVDGPSSCPDLFPTEKAQEKERHRLFKIIEDLVQWENTTNEEVLERARAEIWQSWRRACADNVDHPRAKELFTKGGKVRLLRPAELPQDWDPATDSRLTAWEIVHHLIRVLEAGGEGAAAELVAKLGSKEPRRLASSATDFTRSASARSARRKRFLTTAWSRAGPKSPALPARRARERSRRDCSSSVMGR